MWKCVPRNLRETVERRVTRKISRTEKPPCQEIKPAPTLQTRLICPTIHHLAGFSSPDTNGRHLKKELGKCNWDPVIKIGETFERKSTETCKIVSAVIPTLTQQFNNIAAKGFNACSVSKRKLCCWKKQREEKQQGNARASGPHLEHSWLGALGWSTALVLGWYMIQPLCRLWIFPCDKERYPRQPRWLHKRCQDKRHDARYISLVGALSRTALAQPLSVLSQQQAEELTLLENHDELAATSPTTTFPGVTLSAVPFGPPTAEEALDEAANNFLEAHISAIGEIDNSTGVSLMQQGRHSEALGFFTRGMEYSNPVATYNLAVCYEKGLGINQDLKKAAKYYQVASEQGHATAMYNLGVFHVHGWGGLPVDLDQAYVLFEKASALGQSDAKRALEMVNNPGTPGENNTAYDEATRILLHALGLLQIPLDKELYTSVAYEEAPELVTLSNGSELGVKDLTQLVEDTILKYQSCH